MKTNIVLKIWKKIDSWKFLYLIALIVVVGSYYYGIKGHNIRSIALLSTTYILSLVGFFAFLYQSKKDSNSPFFKQIFFFYAFCAIFYNLSFFSEFVEKQYFINIALALVCLNLPAIIMLIYFIVKNVKFKKISAGFIANWEILLIIFSFCILSLETINTMTRLDSNIYYTYLNQAKSWNLSFDTVINFKLGGHQSIGYTLWGLIGLYLTPSSPAGIRLVNIFLISVSILFLHKIYKKIFPNTTRIILFLGVALFAFNPLILGLIYDITLELPLVCFYIWVIYSILYDKKIFLMISSFFLVFTKETGILLLFGCAIGWFISELYFALKQKTKKWYYTFSWKKAFIFCFAPAMLCLSMLITPLWRQDSLTQSNTAVQTMDSFGINLDNSIIKLKELFILNFSWLFVTLILISGIIVAILKSHKRKRYTIKKFLYTLPLFISTLFFVIFQFIYITYCHIRYITPFIPALIAILIIMLTLAWNRKVSSFLLIICLCAIMIQNFYTLDPISKGICNTINIGRSEIFTTRTFVRSTENTIQTQKTDPLLVNELQLTQSAMYNRQYLYFLFAFEKFIDSIQYNDNTFIAIAPIYENQVSGMTWTSLFGRWYSDELFYDMENKRCVDDTSKTKINLAVISSPNDINLDEYERVYLLSFPYNELFDNENFLKQFNPINQYVISERLWEIQVNQLK